ncbi:MAG: hypothetical protein ABJB34_09100 [Acidobacteriota bacterium]
MATLLSEFKSITEALNDAGIEYAVCGGWAMAIHGIPRATMDIDLLVLADDLEMIRQIAKDRGYDVEGLPLHFDVEIRRVSKVDRESKQLITLDLLLVSEALRDVWETRQELSWDEGTTSVVSRDGLIKMKLLAGRKLDLADIEKLREAQDES